MRLSEIEEAFALGKCTPALMEQFRTALARTSRDLRPQHCYTTAAAMPLCQFPMAKELIEYSLELEGTWADRMRAHAILADLYEKQSDYQNARNHYQLALDIVPAEQYDHYAPDSASRMLVCQLHLDGFTYSDELRRLYEQAQKLDEFSRSFQKCRFFSPWRRSSCTATTVTLPPPEPPMTGLLPCFAPDTRAPSLPCSGARVILNPPVPPWKPRPF